MKEHTGLQYQYKQYNHRNVRLHYTLSYLSVNSPKLGTNGAETFQTVDNFEFDNIFSVKKVRIVSELGFFSNFCLEM